MAVSCGAGATSALQVASGTILVDTGLAAALAERAGEPLAVRATGSGEAEALARRGEVDAVFVHEPEVVRALAAAGAVAKAPFVSTSYVLVGPPDDPAGVRATTGLRAAFARLASGGAPFVSRGDGSGTHREERRLWDEAAVARPADAVETGQGQADTLRIAAERRAYALADAATVHLLRDRLDLEVLAADDPPRVTTYEAVAMRGPNEVRARRLVSFLSSPSTQAFIARWARSRGLSRVLRGAAP